jgi:putative peptidoglycan lipid II flippase
MGLVREQVIGRTLGASRETDLYFVSFTLPDFDGPRPVKLKTI